MNISMIKARLVIAKLANFDRFPGTKHISVFSREFCFSFDDFSANVKFDRKFCIIKVTHEETLNLGRQLRIDQGGKDFFCVTSVWPRGPLRRLLCPRHAFAIRPLFPPHGRDCLLSDSTSLPSQVGASSQTRWCAGQLLAFRGGYIQGDRSHRCFRRLDRSTVRETCSWLFLVVKSSKVRQMLISLHIIIRWSHTVRPTYTSASSADMVYCE